MASTRRHCAGIAEMDRDGAKARRRRFGSVVLLWGVLGCAAGAWGAPPAETPSAARRELTLALIADANGWISTRLLYPGGAQHGLAHLAAPLRLLRQQYPDLLVLSLGEWVTGAPALGDPVPTLLRMADALGVAAALPGQQDLVLALRHPEAWATQGGPVRLASDLSSSGAALRGHGVVTRNGLRIGLIGVTRPGIAAAGRLRALGVPLADPVESARRAVAALGQGPPVDLVLGLVNGAWDSEEERATAAVLGLPPRRGVHELADGRLPVALLVTRGTRRPDGAESSPSVDAVPLVYARPGLVVAHVTLEHGAGGTQEHRAGGTQEHRAGGTQEHRAGGTREHHAGDTQEHRAGGWRVAAVRQASIPADPEPDAAIVALAGRSWDETARWLAQPTRAAVSGYNRKADFMACAGALSHEATVAATRDGTLPTVGAPPAATLLPMLWRFEPLRKRRRGETITRAHLYRWMTHDDPLLLARLTGRQIALLLEPYARYRGGWRVSPSLVLHPGGIVPQLDGRATQPDGVVWAGTAAPLLPHERYPVWLSAYHAQGAGGLARIALLQPDQLGAESGLPLRELVFRWMAGPEFRLPPACASFLAVADAPPPASAQR